MRLMSGKGAGFGVLAIEVQSELTTLHTELADSFDWTSIANTPKPAPPVRSSDFEEQAKSKLANYSPNALTKLLGRTTKNREALETALKQAPAQDDEAFAEAQKRYHEALEEWDNDTAFARRIVAGDAEAFVEVMVEMASITKDDLIGSSVRFEVADGVIHAIPEVHRDEIVPDVRLKQTATGKLSESKMPKSQFNLLYQDYVASVALKVAGDIFQTLPVDEVYVTCRTPMLNTETGHMESAAVLSVQIVRNTFEQLNLDAIDPSDSMRNFNHNMRFTKTKGFAAVVPLITLD